MTAMIPLELLALFAFAVATQWVAATHEQYTLSGRMPPRWLRRLEYVRRAVANEEP